MHKKFKLFVLKGLKHQFDHKLFAISFQDWIQVKIKCLLSKKTKSDLAMFWITIHFKEACITIHFQEALNCNPFQL